MTVGETPTLVSSPDRVSIGQTIKPFAEYAKAILSRRDGAQDEPVPDTQAVFGIDGAHITIGDLRAIVALSPRGLDAKEGEAQAARDRRMYEQGRKDAVSWSSPLGGLLEAQAVTRRAYAAIETAKAQNTHIPGNPYDVALAALNAPLAELHCLIDATPSQRLDAATVERCAQVVSDMQTDDAAPGDTNAAFRQAADAIRALTTEPHQHSANTVERRA